MDAHASINHHEILSDRHIVSSYGSTASYRIARAFLASLKSAIDGQLNIQTRKGAGEIGTSKSFFDEITSRVQSGLDAAPALRASDIEILKSLFIASAHRIGLFQNSGFDACLLLSSLVYPEISSLSRISLDRTAQHPIPEHSINLMESRLAGSRTLEELSLLAWSLSLFPATERELILPLAFSLLSIISQAEKNQGPETDTTERLGTFRASLTEHYSKESALDNEEIKQRFRGMALAKIIADLILREVRRADGDFLMGKFQNLCQLYAPTALLHHTNIAIGERTLADWFSDEIFKGNEFIAALYESRYVNRTDISKSPFIASMRPGGRMAGVFSPSEMEIFELALSAYGGSGTLNQSTEHTASLIHHALLDTPPVSCATPARPSAAPLSAREAFYYGCNIESHIDRLPQLERYFLSALERSKALRNLHIVLSIPALEPVASALDNYPRNFSEFRAAIQTIDTMDRAQGPLSDAEFSYDQLKDMLISNAPMSLMDGGWLQYVIGPNNIHDEPTRGLFKIMAEEFGYGDVSQNHPNMYKILLSEVGITLPDVADRRFSESEMFTDHDFQIPSVLLALSFFSQRYFPELLGVTLAIEMAGLGSFFKAMIRNLEAHQLDATFFRVHTTIDNFGTGHAKMCLDMIESFSWRNLASLDEHDAEKVWSRIWDGFRLLRLNFLEVSLKKYHAG